MEKDAGIWWKGVVHKPKSLEEFKTLFLKEFAPRHEFKEAEAKLSTLKLQDGEKVSVYFRNVRYWCGKVKPPMTEPEVLRQMRNGLSISYKRVLLKKPPQSVDELINRIQQEEDIRIQDQMNRKSVVEMEVNAVPAVSTASVESKEIAQLREELKSLKDLVKGISQSVISSRASRPTRTFSGKPVCWNCEKPGHLAQKCPEDSTGKFEQNLQKYRAKAQNRQATSSSGPSTTPTTAQPASNSSRASTMNVEASEDIQEEIHGWWTKDIGNIENRRNSL